MDWEWLVKTAIRKIARGSTVLDLGGYNGEQAKVALDSGALSAVCVDDGSHSTYGWAPPEKREGVQFVDMDLMGYDRPADIVILQNVIYHFRNPWALMEKVRNLTNNKLILATSIVPSVPDKTPMWIHYQPYEGHPQSWTVAWRPTPEGLTSLLLATGFTNINELGRDEGAIVVEADIADELPIGFGKRP